MVKIVKIRNRLGEVLKERGLTQYELAELAHIRLASIGHIARNPRAKVNIEHYEKIVKALGITDIRELIVLEVEDDEHKR